MGSCLSFNLNAYLGSMLNAGNVQYELTVQDRDNSKISASFISALNAINAFKVRVVKVTENPDAYIKSNRITGTLIATKRFGKEAHRTLARVVLSAISQAHLRSATPQSFNASVLKGNKNCSPAFQIARYTRQHTNHHCRAEG